MVIETSDLEFKDIKQKLDGIKENFYMFQKQVIVNYLHVFTKEKYILDYDGRIYMLKEKTQTYTRIAKLLPIYRALFSKILKSNPIFSIDPNRANWDEENGVDVAEALIENLYNDIKRYLLPKMAMWFIISGNWFAKPIYKNDIGEDIIYEKGKGKLGDIVIKNINPLNIYFQNNTEYSNISECPYVFETVFVDREFAEKEYGIEQGEASVDNDLRTKLILTGDVYDPFYTIDTNKYCELTIFTEKKNFRFKNGRFYLLSDKRILQKRDNPFPDEIGHPYAQSKFFEKGTTLGETSLTFSTVLDRNLNLSQGQLYEHSKKLANPILSLPMRSMIKKEDIAMPQTKIIRVDGRDGEVRYVQPAEFPQYFHINMQEMKEDLNDMNAIHDPTKARRPSGVRSALMLAYLAEQDDMQHAPTIDHFFAGLEILGKKYLEMKKEYFGSIEKDLKLFGSSNIAYTKFSGDKLKGNTNIKVFVSTGLPLNKVARQQVLMELTQGGIIPPNLTRRLLGLGELEPIFKLNMRDKIKQLMEIEKIKKGEDVKVNVQDNHIEHIATLVEFSKGNDFDDWDESIKEKYWQHASLHISATIDIFDKTPLMAYYILNSQFLEPEVKMFIEAEIRKTAIEREKKMQSTMQQPNIAMQSNMQPMPEQQTEQQETTAPQEI